MPGVRRRSAGAPGQLRASFAVDMRIEDEFLTPAREALGTQAWDAAAVEGAALGFRDAIAYALGEQAWRQQA